MNGAESGAENMLNSHGNKIIIIVIVISIDKMKKKSELLTLLRQVVKQRLYFINQKKSTEQLAENVCMKNSKKSSSLLSPRNRKFRLHTTLDCVLPLELDYSVNLPLIFASNGTLISRETPSNPDDDTISVIVPKNEEIVLSCAPNYFRGYPSEKTMRVRCGKDNAFREYFFALNF